MRILINELAKIQEELGYIPESEIERVAREHEMPKAHLFGVISFYSRLYTEKKGDHIIRVCKSVSCGMNHSQEVREAIMDYLDIDENETTKDNRFTLEFVECLGRCHAAPVITIDDEVFEHCTIEKALQAIESFANPEPQSE